MQSFGDHELPRELARITAAVSLVIVGIRAVPQSWFLTKFLTHRKSTREGEGVGFAC